MTALNSIWENFLKNYGLFYLFLVPFILFGGIATGPAMFAVVAVILLFLLFNNRHTDVILLFVFFLLMGDSRQDMFYFFKSLRVVSLIILFVWSLYELQSGKYKFNKLFLLFIPFVLISCIALIYSPMPMPFFLTEAVNKTISFVLFYFVGLHYLMHKIKTHNEQIVIGVTMLIHFVLLIGLLLVIVAPDIVIFSGTRYNGMLGNPNGMGLLLTLFLPLTVFTFSRYPGFSLQYKVFVYILIIMSLLLCSSRNAILSISIFFFFNNGLRGNMYLRLFFIFIFMPLSLLFFFTVDLKLLIWKMGLAGYFRVTELDDGSGRIYAWAYALKLIKENPLIGCGFACEEHHFLAHPPRELYLTGHQGGVHNSYLAYLINTGFVGLLLFFVFIGGLIRKAKFSHFLIAFLGASVVSAMFESWMFSSLNAFHIIFMFMVIVLINEKSSEIDVFTRPKTVRRNRRIQLIG